MSFANRTATEASLLESKSDCPCFTGLTPPRLNVWEFGVETEKNWPACFSLCAVGTRLGSTGEHCLFLFALQALIEFQTTAIAPCDEVAVS